MSIYTFTNIEDLKLYVGGGANQSMELASMEPGLYAALHTHLKKWIGLTFWQEIFDAVEGESLSAAQTALLPYLKRPLAMLGLYEHTKVGTVQFGEGGLFRVETTDMKTAYKYQGTDFKRFYLVNGYEALEHLLTYLENNEADFPTWVDSTGYTRNKSLILNTAEEFRQHYSNDISRFTFESLRPLIEDVELFAIRDLLGEEQYLDLKASIMDKDLTEKETQLVYLLQRAMANFTAKEGIRRSWIRFEGNSLVSVELLEPQGYAREGSPIAGQMSLALIMQDEWANRHLSYVVKYLADNLEEFTLYSDWLDTQAEAAAAEAAEEECPTDYPERCGNCHNSWTHCNCSGSTPVQGIVGF